LNIFLIIIYSKEILRCITARKVLITWTIYLCIDYVPKMFVDQTGDAKIDAIKDKMRHAIMADDTKSLKESVT